MSVNYENPLNFIADIERILKKDKREYNIVFDTILASGSFNNRFYTAFYNGSQIEIDSINQTKKIDEKIITIANEYYLKHQDIVDKSILTKLQKFCLRNFDNKRLQHISH